MKNPTAEQWYDRAYRLHYKIKDYKEAYANYLLVLRCFPKTKESDYAFQQMSNIRRMNVYSDDFETYADSFASRYYDIEQMTNDILYRIKAGIESFPKESFVECDMTVFSKDENYLYCCAYGKLEDQIDYLIDPLDIDEKIGVVKSLMDNVFLNDPIHIIPLNNIIYFQEKGDISYSTSISGGGGGSKSMSIGGAIAGKLMFGDVGAIIGSRAGTGVHINEIKSEAIEHDNRYVVLRYEKKNGSYCDLQLEHRCYGILNELIPEKEYSHVSLKRVKKEEAEMPLNNKEIPVEQLRQLKSLLDEGIITQEDFDLKKKQLLGI